jgi:hypothetical protein
MEQFKDRFYEAHKISPDCGLGLLILSLFGIALLGFRVLYLAVSDAIEKPKAK